MSIAEDFKKSAKRYEHLLEVVKFTLTNALTEAKIKTHSVTGRVKDVDSFTEKVDRKGYKKPFEEMEDIVGVRVVCLFASDLAQVQTLIENAFSVIATEDKVKESPVNEFGYMSTHYTCRISNRNSGPYYDGVKEITFEVQCRTMLMDAWANVSHYLAYKGENSIPLELRRDFHALSGLFHVADRHFELFYSESTRAKKETFRKFGTSSSDIYEGMIINSHTLMAYLRRKFPDREHAEAEYVSEYVEELSEAGYETIAELDKQLDRATEAFPVYERDHPPADDDESGLNNGLYTDIGRARLSLALVDEKFRAGVYSRPLMESYREYLRE